MPAGHGCFQCLIVKDRVLRQTPVIGEDLAKDMRQHQFPDTCRDECFVALLAKLKRYPRIPYNSVRKLALTGSHVPKQVQPTQVRCFTRQAAINLFPGLP